MFFLCQELMSCSLVWMGHVSLVSLIWGMGTTKCPCTMLTSKRLLLLAGMEHFSSLWCHLASWQPLEHSRGWWTKYFLSFLIKELLFTLMMCLFIVGMLLVIVFCWMRFLLCLQSINFIWRIVSATCIYNVYPFLGMLWMQMASLLNKEKLILWNIGLCQLMLIRFNNSLVYVTIIANLFCDFLKLLLPWLSWLVRVNHLCGVMPNRLLLPCWSTVCVVLQLWRFLTALWTLVLFVMPATFVLVQCWSSFMVVPGTLWSTIPYVCLRLKRII